MSRIMPMGCRGMRALAPALLLAMAGCGSQAAGAPPAGTATPPGSQNPSVYAQVASTDLAVGRNRFTFGIIDHDRPLKSGAPRVTFFLLHGSVATPVESTTAHFNNFASGLRDTSANSAAVEIGGVYVTYPVFTHAGNWGAEFRLRHGARTLVLRTGFHVASRSLSPAVGSPAPRSHNPTIAQMPATKLDSGRPPDDMHRLSIAAAIAQHKPLLVLFATAAFCTSRMCGPEIESVQRLEARYRGRVNFIHIEIYKDANPQYGYAPTVNQWRLRTEPWVFVVNRAGIITAKFEGPTPAAEIAPAIQATLR